MNMKHTLMTVLLAGSALVTKAQDKSPNAMRSPFADTAQRAKEGWHYKSAENHPLEGQMAITYQAGWSDNDSTQQKLFLYEWVGKQPNGQYKKIAQKLFFSDGPRIGVVMCNFHGDGVVLQSGYGKLNKKSEVDKTRGQESKPKNNKKGVQDSAQREELKKTFDIMRNTLVIPESHGAAMENALNAAAKGHLIPGKTMSIPFNLHVTPPGKNPPPQPFGL